VRFGLVGMQGWSWTWVPFAGRVGQVKGDQGCGYVALHDRVGSVRLRWI